MTLNVSTFFRQAVTAVLDKDEMRPVPGEPM